MIPTGMTGQPTGTSSIGLGGWFCLWPFRIPTDHTLLISLVKTYAPRLQFRLPRASVLSQVGRELGVHIYVDRARWRMLECLGLPAEDTAMLTTECSSTR